MSSRFYCDHSIHSDEVTIDDQEARHLSQVMRKKVGDPVILFDGSGFEFQATIVEIHRNRVLLRIHDRQEVDRELPGRLTIAAAFPKGDRQTWMIQKLTELGVHSVIPLMTQRGVAQPQSSAIQRLNRQSIEASKQCGRNRLMRIDQPCSLPELPERLNSNTLCYLAHPTGDCLPEKTEGAVCFAIGPEGGFTDDETQDAIKRGWKLVCLGSRILRIETAAIAVAAWQALTDGK